MPFTYPLTVNNRIGVSPEDNHNRTQTASALGDAENPHPRVPSCSYSLLQISSSA